jgi:hypothetical protein
MGQVYSISASESLTLMRRTKEFKKHIEESAEYRQVFSRFCRFMLGSTITSEDFWTIIKEVFASIREKYGVKANSGCDAYFEVILWTELCFRGDLNRYYEAAFELVCASIPKNLQLAVDIYHNLILQNGAIQTLNEYGGRVMQLLKSAFSTNGSKVLDDALDESLPDTIHSLIGFNMPSNSQIRPDWKQWQWFGSILLDGIKMRHKKFAPQIALVLGLTLTGPEVPANFIVNEAVLDGIFGLNAEAVMVELSKPFIINQPMKQFEAKVHGVDFSLVTMRAQKWLVNKRSDANLPEAGSRVVPPPAARC